MAPNRNDSGYFSLSLLAYNININNDTKWLSACMLCQLIIILVPWSSTTGPIHPPVIFIKNVVHNQRRPTNRRGCDVTWQQEGRKKKKKEKKERRLINQATRAGRVLRALHMMAHGVGKLRPGGNYDPNHLSPMGGGCLLGACLLVCVICLTLRKLLSINLSELPGCSARVPVHVCMIYSSITGLNSLRGAEPGQRER